MALADDGILRGSPIGAEFVKQLNVKLKRLAIFKKHSIQKKGLCFVLILQKILFQLENERGFFYRESEGRLCILSFFLCTVGLVYNDGIKKFASENGIC